MIIDEHDLVKLCYKSDYSYLILSQWIVSFKDTLRLSSISGVQTHKLMG